MGIIFGGLLEKGKKIAIGGYKFGGYATIATPSPGVYVVGTILADLILAVRQEIHQSAKYNSPPIFPAIRYICSVLYTCTCIFMYIYTSHSLIYSL